MQHINTMSLVVLSLLVQIQSLRLASEMDLKPVCNSPDMMNAPGGQWRALTKNEHETKFGQESACWTKSPNIGMARDLAWEPMKCVLPVLAKDIPAKPKRVVFVGDSITDNHAESFAWFYAKQKKSSDSCVHGWKDKLLSQNKDLSKDVVKETLKWIKNEEHNSRPLWGCNEAVSYVPLSGMAEPKGDARGARPPSMKAFMHLVRNVGSDPLGKDDVIVMNQGLHFHGKSMSDEWGPALEELLKEWKVWQEAGNAPKLIWRQGSPQHWNTFDGGYVQKGSTSVYQCKKFGLKQLHALNPKTKKEGLTYQSDNYFFTAIKKQGLKADNKNLAYVPIWQATAQRDDDHPALYWQYPNDRFKENKFQGKMASLDCSHFCTHGPVSRFWNSALLVTIGSMQQ